MTVVRERKCVVEQHEQQQEKGHNTYICVLRTEFNKRSKNERNTPICDVVKNS